MPSRRVELLDRDERHLQRHHEQRHDDQEERAPEREAHPGEGIGRERRDGDGDDRGRDGHDEAVDEGVGHVLAAQDGLVVDEASTATGRGAKQRLPPAGRGDVPRVAERADEDAQRRQRPDEADSDDRDAQGQRGARRRFAGASGRRCRRRWPRSCRHPLLADVADVEERQRQDGQEEDRPPAPSRARRRRTGTSAGTSGWPPRRC